MIRQAQTSGLPRKDVPAQVDLLAGPLSYRMLVQHRPPSDTFVAQVFRSVMVGLETRRRVVPRH
jgi:hypothetical protein